MTAEELLATMTEPLAEDDGYCTIDPETRVITIPPEYQLLGVESDEKAERIYFKCPKIVGDNIDLSKLALRVNFRNAGQVVDQYLVDDVAVDGDNITFSWLLSRRVTQYEGDVNFIVCAVRVSGETITNEWNTTLATAQVLEGLEAEMVLPEEETDIVNQLLSLAETRLNDVKEATADANTAASNANQKAQEATNAAEDARAVTEQITKDSYLHTALQSFVDAVTAAPTAYGNAIVKKIEGFIRQKTTTGAQLFDVDSTVTANQATKAILNDGRDLQVTGKKVDSSKWGYVYYTFPAEKVSGKTLYVYAEYDSGLGCEFNIKDAENKWTYPLVSSGTWTTISVPSNVIQCSILFYPNRTTETEVTGVYKNIKVGFTQFETWEPYTGGQPAPNPDYPMVVQGVGYCGFFDGEWFQGWINSSSGNVESHSKVIYGNKIPCKSSDVIKLTYGETVEYLMIAFYKKDGTFIKPSASTSNVSSYEIQAPNESAYFIPQVQKSAGITPQSAKHITVTINDKYAVCVKSKGKNLLDFEGFLNSRGSQYTKCGDRYRITGTGSAYSNPILLSDEDEDFTLTGSVTSESGNGYSVQLLNNAGNVVAFIRDDTKKASGKGCKIRLNYVDAGAEVYEDIMVEKGTSHDKYIPCQSTTTYIPVDYPLFEGDKIVRSNGEYKLLRKWGFKTYDGSDDEDWKINYIAGSEAQNAVYNVYIGDMANDAKKERYVPCNYFFSPAMGYHLNTTYVSVSGNYNIIISPDMKIDTDQKWKDWLKTHIMYCAYELATPTEETLSPEAQKALHSIMATDEQTELTIVGVPADAGIQNQFLLPRNEDGALNTTAYCTAEKNKIVLNELVAQNLDARVNKLEIDNATLAEQTIVVE